MDEPIKLGIVGVCGRGGDYQIPTSIDDRVTVEAVCDVSPDGLAAAERSFDATASFVDFHRMLWEASLDAVIIATPKEYHLAQCVAALERGLAVLCEVPATRSIEEAKELVRVVEKTGQPFMMAENDCYRKEWMLIAELIDDGVFGEPYYIRSERLMCSPEHIEEALWRRTWRAGRNGVTYPTHNLGPVLQWFSDDRIERVSCAGSGHHYTDSRDKQYEQEDTVVMLAETERDRLIVHRQDILSNRPTVPYRFELQGTGGCFESAAWDGGDHRVWLPDIAEDWVTLDTFEDDYLPQRWRDLPEDAEQTGRNGGDYLVFQAFIDALVAQENPPIDVHAALDMTLPGIISERSIENAGAWLDVPDSRDWAD